MAIGVVIWSLATIACGFATSLAALFVLRLLRGIGESVVFPVNACPLAQAPEHQRGRAKPHPASVPDAQTLRQPSLRGASVGQFCYSYPSYFIQTEMPLFLVKAAFLGGEDDRDRRRPVRLAGGVGGAHQHRRQPAYPVSLGQI